jgi:chromosomal replication initiation ATPase DnaA
MILITTPEQLLEEICTLFNADAKAIRSKRRYRELVKIRQYYCYIGRVYYRFSLMSLGNAIGGRDHTTVLHSRDVVIDQLSVSDAVTYNDIEILKSHLELNVQDQREYEQLEQEYNDLLRDYAQLKIENKRLKRDKNDLSQKNITLRQELKKAKPMGIFGQPITVTPLNNNQDARNTP